MNWLISAAHAQTAATQASPMGQDAGGMTSLLPFVLVLGIFYFLLIRPQQKKFKQHQDMVGGLKRGDRVITGGGIIGTITKIESDDTIIVEIADGVAVQVARATVVSTVSSDVKEPVAKKGKNKGTPVTGKQVANDN